MASSSRQQEEVPEQEEFGHDFQYDMGYDQMPTPPQMHSEEIPWQLMMNEIYKNRETMEEVRAEVRGSFEEVWENITNLQSELRVVPFERRKKSTTSAPQRGPTIDPESAQLWAAMEISRKEHEDRMRVELDPKGKGTSTDFVHDSSDED